MLFTTETISNKEIESINNFFEQFDSEVETVSVEESEKETFNKLWENLSSTALTDLVITLLLKVIG